MSTLAEIQEAAEKLPPPEQEELIAFLNKRLHGSGILSHDPVMSIIGIFEGEPGPAGRNAEDILYGREGA